MVQKLASPCCSRPRCWLLLGGRRPHPKPAPQREFVQAVEFPYYLYPRQLWERELVWLRDHRHPHGGVFHSLELARAGAGQVRFHRRHQPAPRPGGLHPHAAPARHARLDPAARACQRVDERRRAGLGGARSSRPAPVDGRRSRRLLAPQLERHGGPDRLRRRSAALDRSRDCPARRRRSRSRSSRPTIPRPWRAAVTRWPPGAARCFGKRWRTRSIPPVGNRPAARSSAEAPSR